MACAFAWWVSAVGVGATTGVVTVMRPSPKLQVNQVTEGKRTRGLDERSCHLVGFDAQLWFLVLRAGASTSLGGRGRSHGLVAWSPKA